MDVASLTQRNGALCVALSFGFLSAFFSRCWKAPFFQDVSPGRTEKAGFFHQLSANCGDFCVGALPATTVTDRPHRVLCRTVTIDVALFMSRCRESRPGTSRFSPPTVLRNWCPRPSSSSRCHVRPDVEVVKKAGFFQQLASILRCLQRLSPIGNGKDRILRQL